MCLHFWRSRGQTAESARPVTSPIAITIITGLSSLLLCACGGAEVEMAPAAPPVPLVPASAARAAIPSRATPAAIPAPPPPIKPWMSLQDWAALAWDTSHAGAPLPLQDYGSLVFSDDFNLCSIGKEQFRPVGHFNWYAHSGTNAGNHATFITFDYQDAADGPPFTCPGDGYLHALARYDKGDKTWHTGDIFTQDTSHEGFATPYGYIEFRARFNSSSLPLRPWIGLWAWSREAENSAANYNGHQYAEIDVVETNLRSQTDSNQNASTLHYWPSASPALGQALKQHVFKSSPMQTFPTFDDQWHTYGLAMTPQLFIVYRDRVELTRLPRVAEDLREPMAPIIDVSSFFGPQGADTSKVYDVMEVDYVHVYAPAAP